MKGVHLLVCLMLVLLVIPIGQGAQVRISKNPASTSAVDWWPMVCHDPVHSGYSTSTIPANVTLQWTNTTIGFMESSPSIVDGKVVVTTADFTHWNGYVYCYDMKTGARLWMVTGNDEFFSSPTIVGDRVYACTLNGNLFCLNFSTGEKFWSVKLGSHLLFENSCPVIEDGHLFMCSYKDDGSYNGSIFCVNTVDGGVVWQISPGTNRDYSLAVEDGKIYGAGFQNQLSCFDASTGNQLWVCSGVVLSTQPSVSNGAVYACTQDGRICCVVNGSVVWQYQAAANFILTNPVAFAYGKVYTGLYSPSMSYSDVVLCLDAATGDVVWSHPLEEKGGVGYMPAVADGKLIVLSSYMYDYPPNFDRIIAVHCYNATDGSPLWSVTVGAGKDCYAYNSPGIADRKVFVCTTENGESGDTWGGLYCLGGHVPYSSPTVEILKPVDGLYFHNRKIASMKSPVIIGSIGIEVNATDNQSGVNRVEFYIDGNLTFTDTEAPYLWNWSGRTPLHWKHTIMVTAFNNAGNCTSKELDVRKYL